MKSKEKLLALEAQNRYLFHGSPFFLQELIPQKPVNFDRKTGKKIDDGDPCISATHRVEIAIFRALTHRSQLSGRGCGSSFGMTPDGEIRLELTKDALNLIRQLRQVVGYIYVLPRENFSKHSQYEWRTYQRLRPLEVIEVSPEDINWENVRIVKKIK